MFASRNQIHLLTDNSYLHHILSYGKIQLNHTGIHYNTEDLVPCKDRMKVQFTEEAKFFACFAFCTELKRECKSL